jgi:hypothetical protein
MSACLRPFTLVLTAVLLAGGAAGARADSERITGPGSASGSLDFRIVVPAVVRLSENQHPAELSAGDGDVHSGRQRLVVSSTLRRGFCVALRLASPAVRGWRLAVPAGSGMTVEQRGDAHHVCAPRPGRYVVELQHEFLSAGPGPLAWPVQTELHAL